MHQGERSARENCPQKDEAVDLELKDPSEFYVILGGGAGLTRVGIQRLNRNKLDPKLHHQFTM